MWFPTRLLLFAAMAFSSLQSSAQAPAEQDAFPKKPESVSSAPTAAKSQTSADVSSTVGATEPVITIRGLCEQSAGRTAGNMSPCSRVITREEFENLMKALNPGGQTITPKGRQNLGETYAEYMAMEAAARKTGLEETPEFREVMHWVRLRTIADLYRRTLQERYRTPSPEETDSYYQQHIASYERVKLARILVPRENPLVADKSEFDKKALAAANAAHDRAVQGEDPAQIEKDVYGALGLTGPPPTDLGNYGRGNFTEKEGADVFSLKAGGVSPIEIEPKSYVIYKVLSKETLPLDQIRTEISREISQQKFKDAIKAATDAAPAEFNEQYFGAKPTAKVPTPAVPQSH
jgi:parvulin-like peptidyl-prolyl isomerase